jgi:nitroreductase
MDDNEILRAIRSRRSVLRFTDDTVDEEKLEAILEAGRWAPSYINSQPWEFVVVRDVRLRSRMADVLRRVTISWRGFEQAPVIIVVAVDIATDPRHHVEDGAAAAQNMTLMAHSLGLATFWAGIYSDENAPGTPEDELRALLGIPRSMRLVAALPVGFPAVRPESGRRPLSEMVHWDGFRKEKRASR